MSRSICDGCEKQMPNPEPCMECARKHARRVAKLEKLVVAWRYEQTHPLEAISCADEVLADEADRILKRRAKK